MTRLFQSQLAANRVDSSNLRLGASLELWIWSLELPTIRTNPDKTPPSPSLTSLISKHFQPDTFKLSGFAPRFGDLTLDKLYGSINVSAFVDITNSSRVVEGLAR